MYYSMRGTVIAVLDELIVLEVNNIGYEINIAHSDHFSLNEQYFIYLHEVVREDEHYLIGFETKEEKEVFLSLITVKGIGPKTALSALGATTPNDFIRAIEASDVKYLKKLPGIGPKAASQIVLDLKGHLVAQETITTTKKIALSPTISDVYEALKAFGFKVGDIDKIVPSLKELEHLGSELLLKEALRLLRK